ncbi:MAG: 3-oxoacyl-[acyl-carrier-protein] reductase [Thermodesulfovibrionales bacterium]
MAVALARAGYRVAINYLADRAAAEEAADEAGGGAFLLRGDVGDPGEAARMAGAVAERWGRLDVLINNAGVARDSLLVRLSEAGWDSVMKTNLKGCFNMARAFVGLMAASGGGHVVNISSRSGLSGKAGQAAYSASKAAVLGLTRSLAAELGDKGIRVNAVLPGYMPTAMGSASPEAMERARAESLLGSLSDPEEVARFVAWLVGTRTVTGQVFVLDSRLGQGF